MLIIASIGTRVIHCWLNTGDSYISFNTSFTLAVQLLHKMKCYHLKIAMMQLAIPKENKHSHKNLEINPPVLYFVMNH